MENASKALLIAGAILLAILLISLGIMVFTQAQSTVETSGMSQAEITAFNNKFLKYEGTKDGTMVKALVNEVLVTAEEPTAPTNFAATLDGTKITSTSGIDSKEKYKVVLGYETATGLVNAVTITKVT